MRTALLLASFTLAVGSNVSLASDVPLTQDELRNLLSDTKSVDEWPNGDRGEAATTGDGKVTYKWIPKKGKTINDTGTWKLQGSNVACFTWKSFSNGCYAYFKDGDGYLVHNVRNKNDSFRKALLH
jgi:hypothetical protein